MGWEPGTSICDTAQWRPARSSWPIAVPHLPVLATRPGRRPPDPFPPGRLCTRRDGATAPPAACPPDSQPRRSLHGAISILSCPAVQRRRWNRPAPILRATAAPNPRPGGGGGLEELSAAARPPPSCCGISSDPSAPFTAYPPPATLPATPVSSTGEFLLFRYPVPYLLVFISLQITVFPFPSFRGFEETELCFLNTDSETKVFLVIIDKN